MGFSSLDQLDNWADTRMLIVKLSSGQWFDFNSLIVTLINVSEDLVDYL